MSIPYVKGVAEPISRILRSTSVQVAMKPQQTLRQLLVRPKDKLKPEEKSGVVYKIDCEDCSASYIGQTGRQLSVRIKEHRRATEKGNTLDSGIAEHVAHTGHGINWNAQVLEQEGIQRRRLVKEAVHIQLNNPSMNRETGVEIDKAFSNILNKAKRPNANLC